MVVRGILNCKCAPFTSERRLKVGAGLGRVCPASLASLTFARETASPPKLKSDVLGMATEDPIDFAYAAILQVSKIASLLGVESRRPVCGRLGAELFLVANYLDTAGLDQEKQLRLRISKLLRDVEAMCNASITGNSLFLHG